MRFALALSLLCCVTLVNAAEYGEPPDGISELAYFASDGGWGDPKNQHRFAAIKISAGKYRSKNGTYASLQELLHTEDLTKFEGLAVECRECSIYTGGNDLQRESQTILEENKIKNLLFWPGTEWHKARQIFLGRTTGKVSGKITAASSREPLQRAYVSSQYLGGEADENGHYEVTLLEPGILTLVASRRDREDVKVEVQVVAGQTTHHDFALPLAKPACCKLEGQWEIVLTLAQAKRPGNLMPDTVGDIASGSVVFAKTNEKALENRGSAYSDGIVDEFGEYDIDLTPFFGGNVTRSVSKTALPRTDDQDSMNGVAGAISHYDRVSVAFNPDWSHGGISLGGQIVEDSVITGEWHVSSYGDSSVRGTFVMKRVRGP